MTEDLLKVARGLRTVYIGLMIVVVAFVLGIIGGVIAIVMVAGQGAGGGRGALLPVMAVVLLVGLVALIGNIVGLVGRFMCLSTPPEAVGARARIMLSVIFEVCGVIGSVVGMVDAASGGFLPDVVRPIAGAVNWLMSLAAGILFLLFIKSLAEFIGRRSLGSDALSVLYMFAGAFGCYLLAVALSVGILVASGGGNNGLAAFGCISFILMIAALVFFLIGLVKYARLLTNTSEAVTRFAETEGDLADDEDSVYRRRYENDRQSHRRSDDGSEEDDRPSHGRFDDRDD